MPFSANQYGHRFPVLPGYEGEQQLHAWLTKLYEAGTIGRWYADGISSDQRGTVAVIEFERATDAALALTMWSELANTATASA